VLPRDREPGHNYLCAGLELLITNTRPTMQLMAHSVRGRPPAMAWLAAVGAKRAPYQLCPCGGGRKFNFCHGDKAPPKPFN
jgi:uncharacterized protein